MKRYLAFYGTHYYPSGGMGDFIGDFDTCDEAEKACDQKHKEEKDYSAYGCVWDSQTRQDVLSLEYDGPNS